MPKLVREQSDEADLRAAFVRGDLRTTAELAFQRYGAEILAFLIARARNRTRAEDAFSLFAEAFWCGLPSFAWRSTLRVWAYKLACNAAVRIATAPAARAHRNLPVSQFAETVAALSRSAATPAYQRSDVKRRMAALRLRLSEEDQVLLMLHVDRGLRFRELVLVLGTAESGSEALEREAMRMRKRFERLKRELRKLALEEGLLGPSA